MIRKTSVKTFQTLADAFAQSDSTKEAVLIPLRSPLFSNMHLLVSYDSSDSSFTIVFHCGDRVTDISIESALELIEDNQSVVFEEVGF